MTEQKCANCGQPIHPSKVGSYPPAVQWVHYRSPVGPDNRWCRLGNPATLAQPVSQSATHTQEKP